ncbi:hypothetical protein M231_00356 [Tremella mesenterica]|uniref:Uncharacterized protein n=1 Tax=Tremella mesenterica TaxID=5217 RepID=A0A4Q1BWC6_TREME|nr:hypothetical protein M231_00356 [Tremella mesenterica]
MDLGCKESRDHADIRLSAAVLTIAMVSYLAMATGMGISYVPIKYSGPHAGELHYFREVYWARYVDWLFTTPLLLLSLALLAGLSPADTLITIGADVFMIVTGLLSTIHSSHSNAGERVKWLFYAVSCVGFVVIWWILLSGGLKAAKLRPSKTRGLFHLLGVMTFHLWLAYPIVFALSEGANKISVNAEIIAYGVLDV